MFQVTVVSLIYHGVDDTVDVVHGISWPLEHGTDGRRRLLMHPISATRTRAGPMPGRAAVSLPGARAAASHRPLATRR
jgi:hypothetical protein